MLGGAALAALAIAACQSNNQAGNLKASALGDTSHLAEHASPVDGLRAACGDGTTTAAGAVLSRRPYVQQVTTSSAVVGWVTSTPDGERVDVTLPDGTAVTSVAATVDDSAKRVEGENQMWATVGGLKPSTIYCYALADAAAPLDARTGFKTAPAADSTDPVRFLAFGDSGGGGSDQYALLDQMSQYPYQLMIHTGDIAYDSGTTAEFDSNVFDVYKELFRNVSFFPAAGNHEYVTPGAAPFRSVFSLPKAPTGGQWYSFDRGRVHFAALDTEADYATQIAWLDADLAKTTLPWKIVYMHRPPYSSGEHGSDTGLRALLAPILEKHHVQLVLAGHDHDYERMTPQNGTAFVVTGGGGIGTRPVGSSAFTAFGSEVIHFVYAEVGTDELVLHAIDASGVEFDSMVVPR